MISDATESKRVLRGPVAAASSAAARLMVDRKTEGNRNESCDAKEVACAC